MPGRWRKANEKELATFVVPSASHYVNPRGDAVALPEEPRGRHELIRAIYDTLAERNIIYSFEEFHPSEAIQLIRTPLEIVSPPRRGTCLDLVTFFCGACLGHGLLPIILLFEGHAIAAVCLTHGLREWSDPGRPGFHKLRRGLQGQEDLNTFRQLMDEGAYVAIECTGFTAGPSLTEGELGRSTRRSPHLDFDEALRVGREQLSTNKLEFGIDIASVHYWDRIEPGAPDSGIVPPELYVSDSSKRVASLTAKFVDRDDVNPSVLRHFASEFKCGYFHIKGDSGVGKTALAASLAHALNATIVFADLGGDVTTPIQCWRYLAAGLIVGLGLPDMGLWDMADHQWQKPLIERLIRDAAMLPYRESQVWFVIDALDETHSPPGSNPLYLPDDLPEGVYILLTSRPLFRWEPSKRNPDMGYRERTLLQDSPEQTRAIKTYLGNLVNSERGADLLRAAGAAEADEFVERLSAASLGNFKYLDFVISHLLSADGPSFFQVGRLPRGLDEYYHRFLRTTEGRDGSASRQLQLRLDIGGLLAAAGEAVTVDWLADHSGAPAADIQHDVLNTWFGPISFEDRGARRYYRIVHQSFADFLKDKQRIDLPALHRRIGAYYLEESNRPKHAGYAVRQVTGHLRKARDIDALMTLLFSQSWQRFSTSETNDPSGSALVADVDEAWALASELDREQLAMNPEAVPPFLAFEVYCALLKSTILTRSQTVPVSLLVTQVTRGRWPIARAQALAELNPDRETRDYALALLKSIMDGQAEDGTAAHEEGVSSPAATGSLQETPRDAAGEGCADGVAEIPISAMLEYLPRYLAELAPELASRGHARTALELARRITRPHERADALARLVDTGMDPVAQLLDEAWTAIRILDDATERNSAVESIRARTHPTVALPAAQPGFLRRAWRGLHKLGARLDEAIIGVAVGWVGSALTSGMHLVPLLVPPAELRALEVAVSPRPLLMRACVGLYTMGLRVRSLATVVACLAMLVVLYWHNPSELLDTLRPAGIGLAIGAVSIGVTALAARNSRIRAFFQRQRMQAAQSHRVDRATLPMPRTTDQFRDGAEAWLFTVTFAFIRALSAGAVLVSIAIPVVIYGVLVAILSAQLKDSPLAGFARVATFAPLFLVFGYALLWNSRIRWVGVIFSLVASLGLAWPALEVPAILLMFICFGVWVQREVRSTWRSASRKLSTLQLFLRGLAYRFGWLKRPWRGASDLTNHTPTSTIGPDGEAEIGVGSPDEMLTVYGAWLQQLRSDARGTRRQLVAILARQRDQIALLGGRRALEEVCASMDLVGMVWP